VKIVATRKNLRRMVAFHYDGARVFQEVGTVLDGAADPLEEDPGVAVFQGSWRPIVILDSLHRSRYREPLLTRHEP
jgi:hypothetical protein